MYVHIYLLTDELHSHYYWLFKGINHGDEVDFVGGELLTDIPKVCCGSLSLGGSIFYDNDRGFIPLIHFLERKCICQT